MKNKILFLMPDDDYEKGGMISITKMYFEINFFKENVRPPEISTI
jgi:hypothetical protein